MVIDISELTDEIISAASDAAAADITLIRSFQKRQVEALAQQSAFVGGGIASGEITENTRDYFLEELERMAESFVKTLVRMTHVLFEKIWNAVVKVVWKAIESAIGFNLPTPVLG